MGGKLQQLGQVIDASQIQRIRLNNGKMALYLPAAAGRGGYLTIATEWCGYCQRLVPEMQVSTHQTSMLSFVVDGDAPNSKDLVSEGFPTIYLIARNGLITSLYNGPRQRSALIGTWQNSAQ